MDKDAVKIIQGIDLASGKDETFLTILMTDEDNKSIFHHIPQPFAAPLIMVLQNPPEQKTLRHPKYVIGQIVSNVRKLVPHGNPDYERGFNQAVNAVKFTIEQTFEPEKIELKLQAAPDNLVRPLSGKFHHEAFDLGHINHPTECYDEGDFEATFRALSDDIHLSWKDIDTIKYALRYCDKVRRGQV